MSNTLIVHARRVIAEQSGRPAPRGTALRQRPRDRPAPTAWCGGVHSTFDGFTNAAAPGMCGLVRKRSGERSKWRRDMIERATAIDLISRGVGKFYNDGRQPVIRFTMSEGTRRREVALLTASATASSRHASRIIIALVAGRPWSSAEEKAHADARHALDVAGVVAREGEGGRSI